MNCNAKHEIRDCTEVNCCRREGERMTENYECDKSPCGEHLQGTHYDVMTGQIEFIYTVNKDKYKARENFCKFDYCPFCGTDISEVSE